MRDLLLEIERCTICAEMLPHRPRPIVSASPSARILIIGQAPGRVVHETGVPWNDKSGDTLRQWLSISKDDFYDPAVVALVPMGFCYPGKGTSGDLAPRPECAPAWHDQLLAHLRDVKLTLLIGSYAQKAYLKDRRKENLTETVKAFQTYLPDVLPLPHPSPRNNIWLKKNAWFGSELLPVLKSQVGQVLN